MDKLFLQAELKKEGDVIEFVASDETLDRHGEKVPVDAWDLKNYKRNPVLLVNHDYRVQNVVGKAKNLRMEGKKLVFEPVFHELTDLAKEVMAMVQEGFLNTVSVGFLPHWPETKGQEVVNELLEISFVPVPANPRAERIKTLAKEAEEKGLDADAEAGLKEFLKGTEMEVEEEVPIKSVEEFKTKENTVANCLCETQFISKLVEDSEKLKTLTASKETNQGRAKKKEDTLRLLKRVAKEVNHALYQANRQ